MLAWFSMLTCALASAARLDIDELVKRSVQNTVNNWKQAPDFVYTEHDIEQKLDNRGQPKTSTDTTYEVYVIDGSQYNKLIAVNGRALAPEQARAERRKMEAETQRREKESREQRAKRIAKYRKERIQNQAMLREMASAFTFKLVGEGTVNGRAVYELNATPTPGYVPKSRDAKVLIGMQGKLYIDKADAQWVKVEAEVIRPVSFYAVATVSPGTKFELEQAPLAGGIWMPSHFAVRVNSNVLWMSRNSTGDERYTNYRRASGEDARVKSARPGPPTVH